MKKFEELLEEAVSFHGGLCAGQVIGVRMAILGCKLIGMDEPKNHRKKLMVFVEIDRCACDAIQVVTGCRLGNRTLKWIDYGIMAATFVNLNTKKAMRIEVTEKSRNLAKRYAPFIKDKYQQQLEAYKIMPQGELFKIEEVNMIIPLEDKPGRPTSRVCCEICGAYVNDRREVNKNKKVLCRGCANGRYYHKAEDDRCIFKNAENGIKKLG
ncbi:MAG: FmdE family protein [Thermodesulfobacteriota bacterium]|nr:FmdE family protein [Thermodesulfobacteriota bacterium]